MKIHVFSDTHEEYKYQSKLKMRNGQPLTFAEEIQEYIQENGNDGVCILAGDICPVEPRMVDIAKFVHGKWAEWFEHVVFTPGNHEYYGTSFREGNIELDRFNIASNWHLLKPGKSVTINGQRFLGGTMWHDGTHDGYEEQYISDYFEIKGLAPGIYDHNKQFVREVCEVMTPDDIIVSHHLPSALSTPRRFKDSVINCFFVSNQEMHILMRKPKLWVHGHTHSPFDYNIMDTRIYANPRGYPGERENRYFLNRACIEVPDVGEPSQSPDEE